MWWIIGITVLALISAILIIRMAMKDAEENMNDTIAKLYDEEIFSDLEEYNEHSSSNIQMNKALKNITLRNKLDKIETEREQTETEMISFGDFDHSRIDGK